jgi:hypothetical protein
MSGGFSMRLLSSMCCCALAIAVAQSDEPKPAQGEWVTVKGSVVFPQDKPIPKRLPMDVNTDKNACLSKGLILDETVIVNPKNRGIKNVVVFLRPLNPNTKQFTVNQIHPDDAKRKSAKISITQPCCMFVNRVTVARVGDSIVVNNPAAIVHNFFWVSEANGEYNANVPSMGSWTMPQPLVAENSPIQYKCTVHGWMTGYVRIFDHPYYAISDEDGKFEIKNAPAGLFRIVYWHETGLRGGTTGRMGEPVTIAGTTTMEMKPVDFDVTPK